MIKIKEKTYVLDKLDFLVIGTSPVGWGLFIAVIFISIYESFIETIKREQ